MAMPPGLAYQELYQLGDFCLPKGIKVEISPVHGSVSR